MKNGWIGLIAVATTALFGIAHAVPVPGQGTWETTLQARDLTGDGVADAFYDTDLNITWLRNANAIGSGNWAIATSWAGNLTIGGVSGWRLPTSDVCTGFVCSGSEMDHLRRIELGNGEAIVLTNTAEFLDLRMGVYWSGAEWAPDIGWAYDFDFFRGLQSFDPKNASGFALAVRNGDVGVALIPEPQSLALVLVAACGLLAGRRHSRMLDSD